MEYSNTNTFPQGNETMSSPTQYWDQTQLNEQMLLEYQQMMSPMDGNWAASSDLGYISGYPYQMPMSSGAPPSVASSSPTSSDGKTVNQGVKPVRSERRKEQNRASQRAFRERREQRRERLEAQVTEWQEKIRVLSESHSQQSDYLQSLKKQLNTLVSQTMELQTGNGQDQWQEFDLYPSP